MKKLPEHTPKVSAWVDLLKKGEFNSQLDDHLTKLPVFSPREDAWKKITMELDREKVVPIWVRWSAAAAVAAILLLSGLFLTKSGDHIQDQEQLAESPVEIDNTAVQAVTDEPSNTAETFVVNDENVASELSPKKKVKRSVEIIQVPKMTLPDLALSQSKNLSLQLPATKAPEPQIQKTLHQVSISWSKIKPGLQVKTSFGRMEADLGQKPQASAAESGQITVEINN